MEAYPELVTSLFLFCFSTLPLCMSLDFALIWVSVFHALICMTCMYLYNHPHAQVNFDFKINVGRQCNYLHPWDIITEWCILCNIFFQHLSKILPDLAPQLYILLDHCRWHMGHLNTLYNYYPRWESLALFSNKEKYNYWTKRIILKLLEM